jgi:spoIIIJ-associated protein
VKKIEANTLEEAYEKAAQTFDCSIMDLDYEIVQHPSGGFLGFGAKKAIIVAVCKTRPEAPSPTPAREPLSSTATPSPTPAPAPAHRTRSKRQIAEKPSHTTQVKKREPTPETAASETAILDGFFDDTSTKTTPPVQEDIPVTEEKAPAASETSLSHTIETRLGALMRSACFDIDTVEVDVIDGTAYIFIDGEDAALLIGKEGYRYNALSYLLYNWIHNEYGLFIKLEIAQFLASQQEMIRNYIQPVIDHVHQEGWGKTRPLDGILVQIALEQLREEFPNKYVAIKRTRNGERYILINEFNKRS